MKFVLQIEDKRWRQVRGLKAKLAVLEKRLVPRLKKAGFQVGRTECTLLLTGDRQIRALNAQFRGMDKTTNVLSFPQLPPKGLKPALTRNYRKKGKADPLNLGDVVLAYVYIAKESKRYNKDLREHTIHMALHGVLHLLGYNHGHNREARIMEKLETDILSTLGIADPYQAGR